MGLHQNHRGVSLWGGLIGLVLVVIGLSILASTGTFAYVGLAGFFNGTYVSYVFYDAVGGILVVVGALIAIFR